MEAEIHSRPIIREVRASDIDFIEGSWIDSYRDGFIKYLTPHADLQTYYRAQRKLIRHLFRKSPTVLIAASPDYDDAIIGYLVCEPPCIVHYLYVRDSCRRSGVAGQLLDHVGIKIENMRYTHVTKIAKDLLSGHVGPKFNPYSLAEGILSCLEESMNASRPVA